MANIVVLSVFSLFFIYELIFDVKDALPLQHIWHEVILFLLSIGALVWQIRLVWQKNSEIKELHNNLAEANKRSVEWRQKAESSAKQIRDLIDQQFNEWGLSQSEKDVALLLIKGFSMKEIADLRSTHEKTVRAQATAIYRKSSLSGRQELAAFFLEDILSQK